MKKATLNYIVDCGIALAFLLSAVSGLVFLVPLTWLNLSPEVTPAFLGVSLRVWNDLHTYASLAMIGGVILHLILHWTWIMTMTRRTFGRKQGVGK